MVFSSPVFLFVYLPLVLLIHYAAPLKWRNGVLLVCNLVFYAWGEPIYILVMLASIVIDYTHGLMVERCKEKDNDKGARRAVCSSVIFNLALLFFFKYWDFIALNLSSVGLDFMPILGVGLPIGISFYTFQTMSYTIDVYRGDAKAQGNIVNFGTFVTLFPQLIAGPIIKYKDLDDQIRNRTYGSDRFSSGIQIFVVGLAKKVLVANNVGMLWETYRDMPVDSLTVGGAWLGLVACTLQIYFDFSGYSDMAIGLGRMLGFEFMKNFNYPYISKSITEFWRRWHISLSSWFREYLYIPLGGNRVSKPRFFLNLMIVWAATGIWHGASWNFLLWGLYFGVLLIIEKGFLGKWLVRTPRGVQHGYTMFLVLLSWAIFSIEDFSHMGEYLQALFGGAQGGLWDGVATYYLRSYFLTIVIALVAATPWVNNLWHKWSWSKTKGVVLTLLIVGGMIISTAYLVDATYNPFLYFRF